MASPTHKHRGTDSQKIKRRKLKHFGHITRRDSEKYDLLHLIIKKSSVNETPIEEEISGSRT